MQSKILYSIFNHIRFRFNKANLVGWYQAEVILALDEMIRVKQHQPNPMGEKAQNDSQAAATWIEKESNKLAKRGTYTQNEKMLTHLYFMDLYKLIEPVAESVVDPNGVPKV
jgi:hypothetical protein